MTTEPNETHHETGSNDVGSPSDGEQRDGDASDGRILRRTRPTIKPALVRLGVTLAVGAVAVAVLSLNPTLLGSVELTDITLVLVQILVFVAVVRILIDILIISNTEYVITDRLVRRSYSLFGRTKSREVPYDRVRSAERSQSRIEYFLGIGTIRLNQGLGDLTLSNLPNHENAYSLIRGQLERSRQ